MAQFNINGAGFKGFAVAGEEAGLVGFYENGVPYRPTNDSVRQALPYRLRKAFDRCPGWWFDDAGTFAYRPLRSARGKLLTTIYAHAKV